MIVASSMVLELSVLEDGAPASYSAYQATRDRRDDALIVTLVPSP
jgi:hypothetical protein